MNDTTLHLFSELYDRYAPALYGIIVRNVNDQPQADSILKSAFHKIFAGYHTYNPGDSTIFIWMYNIVLKEMNSIPGGSFPIQNKILSLTG